MSTGSDRRDKIKVLVVDDSPVARELLVYILGSDPQLEVIRTATNGREALEAVERYRPDVITMDIHMPGLDGLDATRRIMETNPTPIVIVTGSFDPRETELAFRATEAGALAVIQRPAGVGHPEHAATVAELVRTVKMMSEVKVVRRWARRRSQSPAAPTAPPSSAEIESRTREVKLVAVGASTGGPPVLETILAGLPKDFPAPIVIVQHMAPGFIQGFAQWLGQSCSLPVQVAAHGELIRPGLVYFAPDGFQMGVEAGGRVSLSKEEPENGLRPSVAHLFRSVARTFGQQAVGVLLTGMGKDGAEELKLMRDQGALTLAQDEESSVVFGMPGEAVSLGAAMYVLSPEKIAATLASVATKSLQSYT